MNNPLYISSVSRKGGVAFLSVEGNELTADDEGRTIKIVGVSDKTVNGEFPILKVIPPDTIQVSQPNQLDIPNALVGGAIAIGEVVVHHHRHEVTEEVVNKEGDVTWQDTWTKRKKKK